MKILPAFLLLAQVLSAAESADPARKANTVVLDETGVKNLRIETVEVEETDFEETIFALGRIEVLPGKKGVVSSRVSGRAQTIIALPDMKCEEGDELVWVESRQPGDPPPVVRLDAPLGGIIARVNVAVGQPIDPGQSLVEIYDLSTVEASAAVPEHLAGRLSKGQKAHVRLAAFPEETFEAELAHLGTEGDAAAGTLEASFHLPNPDLKLRPGMRAEFSIVLSLRENVMSVPKSALQGDAAARFVYVKDFELKNAFVKTTVEVGQMNDRSVEIVSGLLPGDAVVTHGGYSLAFAGGGSVSLKAALDAAHGHEHNEDGSEMTLPQKKAHETEHAGAGHNEGEGGGMFWKIVSGVLAVLLVLTSLRRKKASDGPKSTSSKSLKISTGERS